ncbi:MAG: phosphodiesterase [Clostridia bacterium]|nr:phosphodiesterase [Clostridia bacterium]
MKLVIASDIHGSAYYCKKLLERFEEEKADKLVLLGDLLYHGPRNPLPEGHDPKEVALLLNSRRDRILAVRGNCDAEIDQMVLSFPCLADYAIVYDQGKTLFLTHGHLPLPPMQDNSVLINGHFHVPVSERRDNYRYLNCGSIALPKENSPHSYLVYEDGALTWKDADGTVFMRDML